MPKQSHTLQPPVFIDRQAEFDGLIKKLNSEPILAVDTEANSLFAYQEQVCLIQISSSSADYIIDPLSLKDLTPLGELFKDLAVEKVFHASEYDLLILHEDFQFEFQNLFDTMIAAQILGREKLGLDALLDEFVGLKVDKKYQRSNWGKRPIPEDMLHYAQVDTHYLIEIRHILAAELEEKNLGAIAAEDFTRACLVHLHHKEEKTAPCWRINGAKKLSPKKAAVLSSLCQYREEIARKINKPVFKVFGASTLLKLAELTPTTEAQLMRLDLPGKRNLQRHASALIKAIQRGQSAKPLYPPKREKVDDSYLSRENALKNWRKLTARKLNVNSAVVLPRELLYKVISENPQTSAALAVVLKDVPWRRDKFGEEILSVLKDANHSVGTK
jgi:ribonuclease D